MTAVSDLLKRLRHGLVVSCQPRPPLDRPEYVAALAEAMLDEGAVAVRLDGPAAIAATRGRTGCPIIGISKIRNEHFPVYITPTLEAVDAVAEAGADIVALDGSEKKREDGSTVHDLVEAAHARGIAVMADVATLDEGRFAADQGADLVATTLSGYTDDSPAGPEPDLRLVEDLARELSVPVIAEGRFNTPTLVREAFSRGAYAVVVGRAITEPRFVVTPFLSAAPRESSAT